MFVSTKPPLIYVHVPRTGGTSMKNALLTAKVPRKKLRGVYMHSSLKDICAELKDEFVRSAWKFGVVRNPWSRMVSRYLFLRTMCRVWGPERPIGEHGQIYAAHGVTFREWLLRLKAPKFGVHSLDLRPQADLVQGADYVGRFEDLNTVTQVVSQHIGRSIELKRQNAVRHVKPYADYYDVGTRWYVGHMFQRDIEEFGYTFETNER